jgi:hypothetical protein
MKPSTFVLPAILGLVAGLAGCNSSCDFRDSGEARCQERSGLQGNPLFGTTCSTVGGVQASGGCPDTELIVGGCEVGGGGGDVIDWYYEPMTVEEVQAECDSNGETFVPV